MRVVFRTDASLNIGTGHVIRCLTLAESLKKRGASCQFVCREIPGNLIDQIRRRGFEVHALPAEYFVDTDQLQAGKTGSKKSPHVTWLGIDWAVDAAQTKERVGGTLVDWIIVDHYALGERWEQKLRSICHKLMVIDDLGNRTHDCDVLLDQNWFGKETNSRYEGLTPANCKTLLGPRFALLNPEYAQLRELMPPRDGIVRRVLVFPRWKRP